MFLESVSRWAINKIMFRGWSGKELDRKSFSSYGDSYLGTATAVGSASFGSGVPGENEYPWK